MDSTFAAYSNGAYTTLPASQLLQERLEERRARNMRPKRSRQTDFGPRRGADDDIFLDEAEESRYAGVRMYDSSPLMTGSRVPSEAASSRYTKRQSIGVRDVDDQLDRLSKQNFALKLELDHRRDHTVRLQEDVEAMKAEVERVDVLHEEHAELLRINTLLVEELEKRDKAVEEAMDIICDLEEKVADMEERRSHTRPSTANADSGYAGTETHEHVPPSSPPEVSRVPPTPTITAPMPPPATSAASHELQGMMNRQTPAKLRREPSVFSLKKPSTHALRSVYLEAAQDLHPVKSFNSLLSKRDSRLEDDTSPDDVLNSPRLSVLSESSFPSLYSPKKDASPEKYTWEVSGECDDLADTRLAHSRHDSIKRVSRWMEDHDAVEETPSKSNRISSPLSAHTERGMATSPTQRSSGDAHFHSLNDALSTASTAAGRQSRELLQSIAYEPCQSKAEQQRTRQPQPQPRPIRVGGPMYGEPLLPPTPDSASTRMLRASRSSIAGERSILDMTPAAVKGFAPLEPGLCTAPKQMRSSIELNSAYFNYQQYRDVLVASRPGDSSSDEEGEDENVDARSETVKDLSGDYDGFPDGNSIIMGTPSRFLKHGRPLGPPNLFDGNDVSPPETARSPPRRRQSSSEVTVSARKPSMSRAETSPTFLGTLGRIVTNGSKFTVGDSVTSPRSFHSGSSSNRTVIQNEADATELDKSHSRVSHTSASPARTLSQRTQKLFRRMSNCHSEPKAMSAGPRSPREKSPLPTLTSTPSSAYINTLLKEARRPSTASEAKQTPNGGPVQPAHGSREDKRPSMQSRTKTEPARAPSVAASERRNPFKRSGSAKNAGAGTPPPPPGNNGTAERDGDGSRARGGLMRRRGSIREAVATRRAWR